MFTGIIEELGKIQEIETRSSGMRFTISAKLVMDDLNIGDSISINGVCLTVTEKKEKEFSLDLVPETLDKSNLGELIEGNYVNLERAMQASDRFGGHILQGHVETLGVILDKQQQEDNAVISVGLDPEWMRYCIPKGSIALDGISLTIANIEANIVEIALIPHTLENTTLGLKSKSDTLNIETDIIGKYVERLLLFDADESEMDVGILKAIRHLQYGES
jgi:riboflavin synthase